VVQRDRQARLVARHRLDRASEGLALGPLDVHLDEIDPIEGLPFDVVVDGRRPHGLGAGP
jgi:hypothetical protein